MTASNASIFVRNCQNEHQILIHMLLFELTIFIFIFLLHLKKRFVWSFIILLYDLFLANASCLFCSLSVEQKMLFWATASNYAYLFHLVGVLSMSHRRSTYVSCEFTDITPVVSSNSVDSDVLTLLIVYSCPMSHVSKNKSTNLNMMIVFHL